MRVTHIFSTSLILVLAACGQAAAPSNADAQTTSSANAPAALSAADRSTILQAIHLSADASGKVTNACDEKVDPAFSTVDLGGAVGVTHLVVIPGGPSSYTCYGDGPGDMHLFRRTSSGFSEIHSLSGGFLVVLESAHGGVKDIADGGPGMSHPLYWWNGSAYAPHGEIADSAMGSAQVYPQ